MPDATVTPVEGGADDSSVVEAAPPVATGEAGEPCNPDMSCGPGLGCLNGTTCVPGGDAGEPCTSGAVCDPGLSCSPGGLCVEYGDAGEPCGPNKTCDTADLYCNSTTALCTVSACAGKTKQSFPYDISADFSTVYTIGPELDNLEILTATAALSCDTTTWAPIPNTGTGDASVGDASVVSDAGDGGDASLFAPALGDGGVQTVTYATPPPCYEFLFDPSCNNTGPNGLCWAGAIFTNSAATADAAASGSPSTSAVGVCLQPAATMVTFWARASLNGAVVKFGSTKAAQCTAPKPAPNDPVAQQTSCKGDTEFFLQLTDQWTQYVVSLPAGEAYNDEANTGGGVWNGFSVVIEPEDVLGGTYIFVKDIQWTNAPPASFTADAGTGEAGASDAGEAGVTDGGDAGDAASE